MGHHIFQAACQPVGAGVGFVYYYYYYYLQLLVNSATVQQPGATFKTWKQRYPGYSLVWLTLLIEKKQLSVGRLLSLKRGVFHIPLLCCSAWNGDKPVHVTDKQGGTKSDAFSVRPLTVWLLFGFCLVFPAGTIMASADDTEGTLTPVDFIQLQHYMEGELSSYIYGNNKYTQVCKIIFKNC